MDEHIQVSLGRRTKGNLACCFHSFFGKEVSAETSYFDGKEWPIKAG